jgi:hypothetical protein
MTERTARPVEVADEFSWGRLSYRAIGVMAMRRLRPGLVLPPLADDLAVIRAKLERVHDIFAHPLDGLEGCFYTWEAGVKGSPR